MSGVIGTEETVVLRAEDGTWHALPDSEFERAHITDPDALAQLANRAADQSGAPVTLLSGDVLAAYRLSDGQAAELDASVADDTAGFDFKVGDIYWWGDHNNAYGAVTTAVAGGTVTLRGAYRVPLNLVAERAVIARGPGYGR